MQCAQVRLHLLVSSSQRKRSPSKALRFSSAVSLAAAAGSILFLPARPTYNPSCWSWPSGLVPRIEGAHQFVLQGAWVVVVISHFPLARSARQRTRPLHRRGWDRAPPPANAYPALSSIAKAVKVVSAPLSVFVKADFTLRFICERLRPQHGDPALISIKREVGPSHLGSRWVA